MISINIDGYHAVAIATRKIFGCCGGGGNTYLVVVVPCYFHILFNHFCLNSLITTTIVGIILYVHLVNIIFNVILVIIVSACTIIMNQICIENTIIIVSVVHVAVG